MNKFLDSYSFLKSLKEKEVNDIKKVFKSKKKIKKLTKDDKHRLKVLKGEKL